MGVAVRIRYGGADWVVNGGWSSGPIGMPRRICWGSVAGKRERMGCAWVIAHASGVTHGKVVTESR